MGIGWVYRYLEKLAKYYQLKSNLKIGIIRTANIYGPYDRFDDIKSQLQDIQISNTKLKLLNNQLLNLIDDMQKKIKKIE